jgi:uncharacterized protein
MKVVLDTNVVASGMLWDGAPRRLLQAARDGRLSLFTSTPLLHELTDILDRRKFDPKIAASGLSIDQLIDGYARLAMLVRPAPIPRIAPDPDDDAVIGTAIAARASAIITGDKGLLSLLTYQGTRLMTVREMIEVLHAGRAAEDGIHEPVPGT